MSKTEDVFAPAIKGKKIPILTLDNKWHQLFTQTGTNKQILKLEEELNGLLKKQGGAGQDMKKIKITVMRKARYDDLIEKYENPIEHACDLQEGQVFICEGWQKPDGFCDSAWESVSPFVMTLAHGGENFYDGWMKNPKSAMISCNDGFRPVSFLIEVVE